MGPSSYFSQLFGRSPVRPLQQHMDKVYEGVQELAPFFNAVCDRDWDRARAVQERIAVREDEADVLKKNLRLNLPKSLMLPVARSDLLDLVTMQDRIVNTAKDISGLMLGRCMELPAPVAPLFLQFAQRSVAACKQAKVAIDELDELFETGFRGTEVEVVESMIQQLDAIEKEADEVEIKVRRQLFEVEKELPPVDVMFLYKIIEWTGDVADLAQRVGSRLQLLLAR